MKKHRDNFLEFSSEITGFSPFDLEGTGMVDTYLALIDDVLAHHSTEFHHLVASVVVLTPAEREQRLRKMLTSLDLNALVVRNLISLWYLGVWNQLPDEWYAGAGLPKPGVTDPGWTHVPNSAAYIEQLSYRAAGAHPPGARPTGFGSWSMPPVYNETL